jgi:hypothetical protein
MNRVHFIGADPGEPTKNFTGYLGGGTVLAPFDSIFKSFCKIDGPVKRLALTLVLVGETLNLESRILTNLLVFAISLKYYL